jgi:hypothetical protein
MCREVADVAFSEQRILLAKTGTKTIRLFGPLPCKQARYQFYAVDGLGSIDCTGQTGHFWGVGRVFTSPELRASAADALGRLNVWEGPKYSIRRGI